MPFSISATRVSPMSQLMTSVFFFAKAVSFVSWSGAQ
jgi:hypothetical protein